MCLLFISFYIYLLYLTHCKSDHIVLKIAYFRFDRSYALTDEIRIRNALAAAETLGDYPIVSADEARQRLRAGNYQTSAPCALPEDADIAGEELVYRTGSREQLLLPYYRFYVRLPDTDMEYADGLQLYGAYYVPAIADAYLENMPVYDGRFN